MLDDGGGQIPESVAAFVPKRVGHRTKQRQAITKLS